MSRLYELLGREPERIDLPEVESDLGDRVVVVTGAAGSIGSELTRQIARYAPSTLVLVDRAETPLYYLDLELRENHPDLRVVSSVADVADPGDVDDLFERFMPDRVFHAAAYKHIPMMEINPRQAIRNNVLGTANLTRAVGAMGSGSLMLVSTDKAVSPSSVMGATKRVAELLVLYAQSAFSGPTFGAVRFGNVLGSNGSVVELFQRQIEAGKPLTITHAEVTRYLMTVDEAVRLLLRASVLPAIRGAVAMLEMGEPVRIVDIAQAMLERAGSSWVEGKTFVFTELRRGEKLHEELVAPDEEALDAEVPGVRLIRPERGTPDDLRGQLHDWLPLLRRDPDTLEAITHQHPEIGLQKRGAESDDRRLAG